MNRFLVSDDRRQTFVNADVRPGRAGCELWLNLGDVDQAGSCAGVYSQELPRRACHRLQDLDRGDLRPKRCITVRWPQPPAQTRPSTVNVTMPLALRQTPVNPS